MAALFCELCLLKPEVLTYSTVAQLSVTKGGEGTRQRKKNTEMLRGISHEIKKLSVEFQQASPLVIK
jgi:hypothetical protein